MNKRKRSEKMRSGTKVLVSLLIATLFLLPPASIWMNNSATVEASEPENGIQVISGDEVAGTTTNGIAMVVSPYILPEDEAQISHSSSNWNGKSLNHENDDSGGEPLPTLGTWRYVGGSGADNYTSIQNAINDSEDGDTVYVYGYSSPYKETLSIGVRIDLLGENKDNTTIDGRQTTEEVINIKPIAERVYISGFTITNSSGYGIFVNGSSHNTISGNNITNNKKAGIRLHEGSESNLIANNSINIPFGDFNSWGVYIWNSPSNTVTNNRIICSGSGSGITLGMSWYYDSPYTLVTDNHILNVDRGMQLSEVSNSTIIGNEIINSTYWSGFPIMLYGQTSAPFTGCNDSIISNNIIDGGGYGVYLQGANLRNTISWNKIYNTSVDGSMIWLGSAYNNVNNNTFIYCGYRSAILLESDSHHNIITNNIATKTTAGCGFACDWKTNCYNIVEKNIFYNTKERAIRLTRGAYNNIIRDNFLNNTYDGDNIYVGGDSGYEVHDNEIVGNMIMFANRTGLRMDTYSYDNIAHHNAFINNTENANDTGNNNQWDDGSEGNYWSDYKEKYPDAHEIDGIWDTPYNISGKTPPSQDRYPLVNPLLIIPPPELQLPENGIGIEDQTPTLDWADVLLPFVSYGLQVATNETFPESAIVINETGITESEYTSTETLPYDTYYWRVKTSIAGMYYGDWSEPWSFFIGEDVTPPTTPDLISPEKSSTLANPTPFFDWSDAYDAFGIGYYTLQIATDEEFENIVFNKNTTDDTSEYKLTWDDRLEDPGDHYWRVRAVDRPGNIGHWSDIWNLTLIEDTKSPVVELFYPIGGEYLGGTVTISWDATDDLTPAADLWIKIEYKSEGAWQTIASDEENDGSYLWDTTKYPDGTNYVMRVSASDYWHNIGLDESNAFTIDNTPPRTEHWLQPPEPNGENGWYNSDVDLYLIALDETSGIKATYFNINGGSWIEYCGTPIHFTEGEYTIGYYSIDIAGIEEKHKFVSIKIDTTAPKTTHELDPFMPNGENDWYVSNIKVKLSPTDATSGVWHTYYRIDGGDWKTGTSFTIDEDGKHLINYYSEDNAGNKESKHSFNVKLDKTPPKATITAPLYKYLYIFGKPIMPINKTIVIGKLKTGVDASDETSGVDRVEFWVDGNITATDTTLPYEWCWNIRSFFMPHEFEVVAYDKAGNSRSADVYIDIVLYLGIR